MVGIRPSRRSRAKSSTAIGRGRNGSAGRDSRTTAWTRAIAAPAARRRSGTHSTGQPLVPRTTDSTLAGVPASSPSRSAPSSRGAGKPCCSATASAAAFVVIISGSIRLLGDRKTTANGDPPAVRRSIHHGLSPPCRECAASTATPSPTCATIQPRAWGKRPSMSTSGFPHTTVSHRRIGVKPVGRCTERSVYGAPSSPFGGGGSFSCPRRLSGRSRRRAEPRPR